MLIGSHFGPWIRTWKTSTSEANLGQCFIAIDPSMFEDEFEERLQKLIDYCRALPPSSKFYQSIVRILFDKLDFSIENSF